MMSGPLAFADPEVSKELALTDTQQQRIKRLVDDLPSERNFGERIAAAQTGYLESVSC